MKKYLLAAMFIMLAGTILAVGTASAQESKSAETAIRITIGDKTLRAALNTSRASQEFLATLPRTLSMQRLYDREYYAVLPIPLSKEGPQQTTYELGDIAFWTKGDYFGLLFSFDRPKLSSPIIIMGKIRSDLAIFDTLGRAEEVHFEVDK